VVRAALRDHGSVYEIDVATVQALAPDLVLTQGICDVCAVPEGQAIDALSELSPAPRILTLDAHDLAAIFQSICDVARATGATANAEVLLANIGRRIEAVRERVAGRRRPRPRVLALEWLDPPYVPGHWVPELVEMAGGELLAGTARRPSYRVEWPALRALEPPPDLLLLMPCGLNLEETRREADRYQTMLCGIAPTVRCLDAAAYFSRSGPRVVDGLEILASAIFPS
jgi:iron complex transport system substrate-binding protein